MPSVLCAPGSQATAARASTAAMLVSGGGGRRPPSSPSSCATRPGGPRHTALAALSEPQGNSRSAVLFCSPTKHILAAFSHPAAPGAAQHVQAAPLLSALVALVATLATLDQPSSNSTTVLGTVVPMACILLAKHQEGHKERHRGDLCQDVLFIADVPQCYHESVFEGSN